MAVHALFKAGTALAKQTAKQSAKYGTQGTKQITQYVVKNPGNALKYTVAAAAGAGGTMAAQAVGNTVTGIADNVSSTLDDIQQGFEGVFGGPANVVDEVVDDVTGRDNSTLTSILIAGGVLAAFGLGVYALAKED